MKLFTRKLSTTDTNRGASRSPAATRLLCLSLALATSLALIAPSAASARPTRVYESSITSFSGQNPQQLAVDQVSGDIYAVKIGGAGFGEGGNNAVSRFTSTGAPDNFTAGPYAGTNTLNLTTGFAHGVAVAIDRSGGPLNGSIIVTDPSASTPSVKIFANNGTVLGSLDGSGTSTGLFGKDKGPCGVAVDQSTGDIYVGQDGNGSKIWRYVQKSSTLPIDDNDFTVTGISTGDSPCSIAADSGNVYAAEGFSRLSKYLSSSFTSSPAPGNSGTVLDPAPVTAVYVDPQNGDVYANEGHQVAAYDKAGARLYDFGFAAYFGADSGGIAVKSAVSGAAAKAYVADPNPGGTEIDVFGPVTNVPVLTHPTVGSFGKDGTSSTSFTSALGTLAYDEGTRRLFALDQGVSGLYGFDASAPPVFPPLSGFAPRSTAAQGSSPGLAVDNTALGSAGNVYLASQATDLVYGFDSSGAPLGGAFPIDPSVVPGAPDGSPADLCGAAVDGAGNIFVANAAKNRILKYSSAGAPLPGVIDTSLQGRPCDLAFDSNQNLYVEAERVSDEVGVWRYSAASGYSNATPIDISRPTDQYGVAIAVDPSNDHVYVAHHDSIPRLKSSYLWVDEYDASGAFVDEFATERASSYRRYQGVTVDPSNHFLYLSEYASQKVTVFGPGVILPELKIGAASGVTNTTAILHGDIGAQGTAVTDCHFEYVSESAFRAGGFSDLSSGGSVPCSPASGSIPLDFTTHPVTGSISGLSASNAYRFRLVAANSTASSTTSDVAFITSGRPIVETVGAPVRTATSAQLGARVDPRAAATTYYFEYGDQGPCDANPCTATPAQPAGSGDVTELVAEEVTGLSPGVTYHYRVLADNGNPDGVAAGEDMTVTTQASDAPLSHGHFPGPAGSDRAYEQVSPPDTGGNAVSDGVGFSTDGNRALFEISGGTPISEEGNLFSVYFAQRAETAPHQGSWLPKSILPPRSNEIGNPHWLLRADASLSTVIGGVLNEATKQAKVWRLDPEAPAIKLAEGSGGDVNLVASRISDDGSRLMAALSGPQDPEYPQPANANPPRRLIYDLTSGAPKLVGFLPDGSVPACGITDMDNPNWAVWPDGSFVAFGSRGSVCTAPERVYLRDLGAEQTKLITPPPLSGAECDAVFLSRAPGAVFLWTKSRLGADDTAPANCTEINDLDGDVYRYDLGDETLECVTCIPGGPDADVHAVFNNSAWRAEESVRVADDGSRVYFQSWRALVPGAPAVSGDVTTYRVNVETGDLAWVGGPGIDLRAGVAAFTPDGTTIAFQSDSSFLNPLNGSDNDGTVQYYRYDDRDRSLVCISCPADGSAPRARVGLDIRGGTGSSYTQISNDGRDIAFATPTPLVDADQNTSGPKGSPESGIDVYEWRDGRPLLVTDGLSNTTPGTGGPSVTSISHSGRDLYFIAPTQYTPDALDGYRRLYDARIGGGFEYPKPPPPCPLEVCQGTPKGAPEERAPGTGTFAGPGNVGRPAQPRCGKGKARRKGRCVAKKPKHAKNRANHNRRAAR